MLDKILPLDYKTKEKSIIKVIGVGGGGSNAVNHMQKSGITGVDFVICNTDAQALDNSTVEIKIQLGETLTEGRGAGNKPARGRESAIESLNDIDKILDEDTKMVFVTAGMGGGTGTGAAPVIAAAARAKDMLTVGIVTIPFRFEGERRLNQAQEGIEELEKHVDALLVINNEKLRLMYGDQKLSSAFNKADDILSIAAKSIAEIITVHGYVNVDFADVVTVMRDSGVAVMGSGTSSGESRAIDAIDQALKSPLLNSNDIKGAQNILLNITSGADEVTMREIADITDYVQDIVGNDVSIIWGNGTDLNLEDSINVTIIATGFRDNPLGQISREKRVEDVYPKLELQIEDSFDIEQKAQEQRLEEQRVRNQDIIRKEAERVEMLRQENIHTQNEKIPPLSRNGRKEKRNSNKKESRLNLFKNYLSSVFDDDDTEMK